MFKHVNVIVLLQVCICFVWTLLLRIESRCSKSTFNQNRKLTIPQTAPHTKTTLSMQLPSRSKSHSHFVAFFLKAKVLAEAIAAKHTFRSRNTVKKCKILKNRPKNPDLSNPSTTATYTVAIPSIYSSVVSENKQEEATQFNVTNTLIAATPTTSTPESTIDFNVEITSSAINVKLKTVKELN